MSVIHRRSRLTSLIAALAILAPGSTAFAQTLLVQGTVRSSQGAALQGAQVRIADLNVSGGTNADGLYRIFVNADRRGQTFTLSVRAIGYKPQSKQVTIGAGAEDHDFMLEFDVNRVSEVVVSGPGAIETKRLAFSVDKAGNVYVPPATANFSQHLYPPELIMQNQGRLGITEAQREAILAEIYKVQATAAQVQWRLAEESEKLNALLEREYVPEGLVLEQSKQMIAQETSIKQAQLTMLVRIRNLLTAEQKAMLNDLRRRE